MELRHLRYFVCVAEELNISRAAHRLHIAQPPLTRQIRQLEEEVGTKLFLRTARGVELTDAGLVLLDDAHRLLELADRAGERTLRAGQGVAGRLDVALFGTGTFGAIPQLLRRYRLDHPDVKIVLHNMTKAEQLDALEQRRISLAFNRLMRPTSGITSEVLLTEPLYVAVPSDHPLAARTAIGLGELDHEPIVVFPTGIRPSFIDQVYEMFREAGATPNVAAEVADVVHGITFVAIGGAICLVPHSATNLHVPGVTYRPLHGSTRPNVDLCCIYREGDTSPVLHGLLVSMRAAAPQVAALRRNAPPLA
jgi:DNA-binding transcriptional LysR family regulator